jgi:hypothetical protein
LLKVTFSAALCVACSASPTDKPWLDQGTPIGGSGGATTAAATTGAFTGGGTNLGAPCDPTRSVQSDGPALLVRDPDILSRFPLDRVLGQIVATAGAQMTPEELLQRLFDTENTAATGAFPDAVHCDDAENEAFSHAEAVDCPRAEGALAKSGGLFVPGDPDFFTPIALINRFDLMPENTMSCGEYRIVYAKWSGLSDPSNRAFLILEAALRNPTGGLAGCRPVAELWASLEPDASSASRADKLEKLYFEGVDGSDPVVHADHYGLDQFDCSYSGACGQVRLGQGMQAPWEFRQLRLRRPFMGESGPPLSFAPTRVTNSPRPELFDPALTDPQGSSFRTEFAWDLRGMTEPTVARIRRISLQEYDSGQSAIEGAGQPDYLARVKQSSAGAAFIDAIAQGISHADLPDCPPDDPITHQSILERATALSCAGCHAPERLLSPERKVGCGLVWPKSLGEAHIDEHGVLSDALTQVFLPHRADVFSTYLQACDEIAIRKNLQPVPEVVIPECFVAGTPITMADGSTKPIEQIVPGELVLAFDLGARAAVPAHVARAVVRPHAERLVVINETLVATANHPFYTSRGWARAEQLEIGTALVEARNADPTSAVRLEVAPAAVQALMMQPGSVPTYNLEVAVHHTYFAGGLLVHDRP